ncbi:radical SAM protein [Acidaminobacter sp. JC074]|uniref:4Fe-4S cluster-binding domain-containing protein n=1 Tax=Acidaminobacter sp. JC074 TaxID=2530199 RepID=UPI001F0D07CA|nr:4Fe-4S cluster-binding domain-containing protein [Acidaminobacter sp. JC074]MCH4890037.1 radical SAM protein [Acidaminobacter sp. JC074]
MKIRYKSITHERLEDAPFVGALVCALDCNIGCKGCFNQSLKEAPIFYKKADEVLDEIMSNPFNEGVILAGLEWSLQPSELMAMIKSCASKNIPVIVYTGHKIETFLRRVPKIKNYPEVLIKYGAYDESKLSLTHEAYGVRLASTNQNIQSVADIMEVYYKRVI